MTMLTSDITIGNAAVYALLGYGVVFFGLILLMLVVMAIGSYFAAKDKKMAAVAAAFDKQENRTGVNAPTFQFMRVGYFCLDNRDSTAEHLVFNRSVSLKDSFKK